MSSRKEAFEKEISSLEQLFYKGMYKTVLCIIETLEKEERINKAEQTTLNVLKSTVFTKLGDFNKSLDLLNKIFKDIENISNKLTIIDAYIAKCDTLMGLGRFDEAFEVIAEGEDTLSKLNVDSPPIIQRKATLKFVKGATELRKGDFDNTIKNCKDSLVLYQKLRFEPGIGDSLHTLGTAYYRKSDLNKALEFLKEAIIIRECVNNKRDIAFSLNNIALIYQVKGDYQKSLEHFRRSFNYLDKLGNKQAASSTLVNIGSIYREKGMLEEALSNFKTSLSLRNEIGNNQAIAESLHCIGLVYLDQGELNTAIDYFQRAMDLREQIGNLYEIALTLSSIGLVNLEKGELEKSLDCFQRVMGLHKNIGNKWEVAWALNNIGIIYERKGDLITALKHQQEGLRIREEIENKPEIAFSLYNIGLILLKKGELDSALESNKKSLEIFEELGNKQRIGWSLTAIGNVYYHQGKIDTALKYHQDSLQLRYETGNVIEITESLFHLILILVELNDIPLSKQYFQNLSEISESEDHKILHLRKQISEALILSTSPIDSVKQQAQIIFQEIIDGEIIDHALTILSVSHLCELFLENLRISENFKILDEIKDLILRISLIAKNQKSHSVMVNLYLLQTKLALVEGDLAAGAHYLEQAEQTTKEKGLGRLSLKVKEEQKSFENQYDIWQDLIQSNASIQERLEQVQFENYLQDVKRMVLIHQ